MDEGHCGLPLAELVPMAVKLLQVPPEIIETALDLELKGGEVIADAVDGERCIFLAGLHRAERAIARADQGAEQLRSALAGHRCREGHPPGVETKVGITLAASQREAVQLPFTRKVLVITGGPGVGKTTLVNSILKILSVKGVRIALHRPRGKAAFGEHQK